MRGRFGFGASGSAGHSVDAVSAETQKNGRCPKNTEKFPNRNVQTFVCCLEKTIRMYGRCISLHPSENGGNSETIETSDISIHLPRHKWPILWLNMEDPVVLLERNPYGHRFA